MEISGFFQAMWDEEAMNPITEEYTGWWDRNYDSDFFKDYFKQFVSNGVFGSPTNQLKVIPGGGLSVIVTPGWAMINGAMYHNDTNKTLIIPANENPYARIDSIKLRCSENDREIVALSFADDVEVIRTESIYELKLAEINVATGTAEITASNITDTRPDENVCGFVTGVLEVETTADLFAQYESQFNDWFDDIKDQLTGDLAVRLQLEFNQLNTKVDEYEEDVEQVQADLDDVKAQLTHNNSTFNLDFQNNKWGWNESPSRGADTFHPFKSALKLDYIGSGNSYGAASFTVNLEDADELTNANFFFKNIDVAKTGNFGASYDFKFGGSITPNYNPSTHVLTIGNSGWDVRDYYQNDESFTINYTVYCLH